MLASTMRDGLQADAVTFIIGAHNDAAYYKPLDCVITVLQLEKID